MWHTDRKTWQRFCFPFGTLKPSRTLVVRSLLNVVICSSFIRNLRYKKLCLTQVDFAVTIPIKKFLFHLLRWLLIACLFYLYFVRKCSKSVLLSLFFFFALSMINLGRAIMQVVVKLFLLFRFSLIKRHICV